MSDRITGKVKFLNTEKQTGFISKPENMGGNDFSFNVRSLKNISFSELKKGMQVSYLPNIIDEKTRYANSIQLLESNDAVEVVDNTSSENPTIQKFISDNSSQNNSINDIIKDIISPIKKASDSITDYFIFEDYTAIILKLLGITEIYPVPQARQAGNADGFFKIKNLEVYYDCTLSSSYQDYKKDQIDNYISKINQTSIRIDGVDISLNRNADKQVWIITKGFTKQLKKVDDIEVKEINLNNLISLVEYRISEKQISLNQLVEKLRTL